VGVGSSSALYAVVTQVGLNSVVSTPTSCMRANIEVSAAPLGALLPYPIHRNITCPWRSHLQDPLPAQDWTQPASLKTCLAEPCRLLDGSPV